MTAEADFLAAIAAHPADDTPRLVYADWLEERGDADRAAYLRAAVDMVGRCGDGRPEGPAMDELLRLAGPLPEDWRAAAASRFMLVLFGCDPARKIHAIKLVREVTGQGLAEAKATVERAPSVLVAGVPFEAAYPVWQRFTQQAGLLARLFPSDAPLAASGLKYRITAGYLDVSDEFGEPLPEGEAETAFRNFVAAAFRIAPDQAAERIVNDGVILATDVDSVWVASRRAEFEVLIPPDLDERGIWISVSSEPQSLPD